MGAAPQYQTSKSAWDGRPGTIVHCSDEISIETAVTANKPMFIPWAMTFAYVGVKVTEVAGTGPGTVAIGKLQPSADPDKYLDDYSIATSVAAGTILELVNDAAMVIKDITPGDTIYFNTDGGATTTGKVVVTVVLVPTA